MVPKITRGGTSFKGAFAYYLHDKGGAATHERIEWAHTENMRTGDPAKAWKVMAYTARAHERLKEASGQSRAGRKLEKPVFAFSLAWHPDQAPDRGHMLETARKAIEVLGLSEHEHVIVAHKDEPQKHVHIIVNRVHPLTGVAGDIRNSKRKLSSFALEYERSNGKIYCKERAENHEKRKKGEKTLYSDRHIVEAWETTDSGHAFAAALQKHGCTLARGYKRIVIVDPHGKAHNPTRLLKNVKAKDIQARLSDLDLSKLPVVGEKEARPKRADAEKTKTSQERFEALASTRIYAMREKHRQEEAALTAPQRLHLQSAKSRLAKYYTLRERKEEIMTLAKRIKSASWWERLLGKTRHNRELHTAKVQSYKSALERYRESIAHVAEQNRKSLAELQARQTIERSGLDLQIETLRQHLYGNAPGQELEKDRSDSLLRAVFSAAHDAVPAHNRKKVEDSRIKARPRSYPL